MGTLFSYSFMSGLLLSLVWLVYRIGMSRTTCYAFNRVVLIAGLCVAFVVPAMMMYGFMNAPEAASPSDVDGIELGLPSVSVTLAPETIDALSVASYVYVAGFLISVAYMIISIYRLLMLISKCETVHVDGKKVMIHDDDTLVSFTWGGHIVLSRTDYERNRNMVIVHETAHLERFHWVDLLFAKMVSSFTWYWPTSWMVMDELRSLHEYEADYKVVKSGVDRKDYQMLLIEKTAGVRFQSIASSFNNSSIKLRIIQMMKKQSKGTVRMRALAMLPALALAMLALNTNEVKAIVNEISASNSVVLESVTAPDDKSTQKKLNGKIYESVEHLPEYPGGMVAMQTFLKNELKYPEEAIKNNEEGTVVVRFVVSDKGDVCDAKVIRSVSKSLDAEALRVVNSMPAFKPGLVGDKPVNVYFTLPCRFALPKASTASESKKQ